jgi:hypothetical protein
MNQSTRASCTIGQNPCVRSIGSFVVAIATMMSMISGIAASRVASLISTRVPQTISTTPTKGAIVSGAGIPIFTNRPTPKAWGNKNF